MVVFFFFSRLPFCIRWIFTYGSAAQQTRPSRKRLAARTWSSSPHRFVRAPFSRIFSARVARRGIIGGGGCGGSGERFARWEFVALPNQSQSRLKIERPSSRRPSCHFGSVAVSGAPAGDSRPHTRALLPHRLARNVSACLLSVLYDTQGPTHSSRDNFAAKPEVQTSR